MIVYIVNLDVEVLIADEYLAWLRAHADEMRTLPGFLGGRIFEQLEPAPQPGRAVFSVHYRLRDRAAFEDYLREHAPRMREAGLRAFGARVRASRGLLQALE